MLLLLQSLVISSCETVPQSVEPETVAFVQPVEPSEPVEQVKPTEPAKPVEVTEPVPVAPPPVVPPPIEPPVQVVFDPMSITEERRASTKADIQGLITELNSIIRARNYNTWLGYLAKEYLDEISSRGFLEERTEDLYRRDQIVAANMGRDPRTVHKRVLMTPRDYFDLVVVPSRTNDRVDDIAYVSEYHVKAYTMDSRGQRLILYELVMIDNKWKISH